MKKIFKKTKNKKSAKKLAETSVIKGTVIGLLVAATGSIVNGFVQYYSGFANHVFFYKYLRKAIYATLFA
jgi:hypothetical protein